mgnify:CR=1 FL=1
MEILSKLWSLTPLDLKTSAEKTYIHQKIQSFQGDLLEQDTSKGIIMSTQSLVLQHIEVDAVGTYSCRAVNSEGAGESNPVPLKIMCKFHR